MIELVVFAGTCALAGWAATAQARQRTLASRALERYASSRGLVYVPPPARPRGASPRVVGTDDDVAWSLDFFRVAGAVRMRVSAQPRGRGLLLTVLQRSAFDVPRGSTLRCDDDSLDDAYAVTVGNARDLDALRDVKAPLLALASDADAVCLSSNATAIALSWHGTEGAPRVLDAAREVVSHIARRHGSESAYR